MKQLNLNHLLSQTTLHQDTEPIRTTSLKDPNFEFHSTLYSKTMSQFGKINGNELKSKEHTPQGRSFVIIDSKDLNLAASDQIT